MRKVIYFFLTVIITLIIQGCITIPEESDQPWNARQDWEGSPSMPGFDGN